MPLIVKLSPLSVKLALTSGASVVPTVVWIIVDVGVVIMVCVVVVGCVVAVVVVVGRVVVVCSVVVDGAEVVVVGPVALVVNGVVYPNSSVLFAILEAIRPRSSVVVVDSSWVDVRRFGAVDSSGAVGKMLPSPPRASICRNKK